MKTTPANPSIVTNPDGTKTVSWRQNGHLHRDNGPAVIEYWSSGVVKSTAWYQDGEYYRDNGLVVTEYTPDGAISSETWLTDGHTSHQPPVDVREAMFIREYDKQYTTPGEAPRRGYTTNAARLLLPYAKPLNYDRDAQYPILGDYYQFTRIDSHVSKQLVKLLPDDALDCRYYGAPIMRRLLNASIQNPSVSLNGYCISPTRDNERITIDSITIPETPDCPEGRYGIVEYVCRRYDLGVVDMPEISGTGGKTRVTLHWN